MFTNKIIKDIELRLERKSMKNRHTILFKHLPDMVMTRFYHVPVMFITYANMFHDMFCIMWHEPDLKVDTCFWLVLYMFILLVCLIISNSRSRYFLIFSRHGIYRHSICNPYLKRKQQDNYVADYLQKTIRKAQVNV